MPAEVGRWDNRMSEEDVGDHLPASLEVEAEEEAMIGGLLQSWE